MIINQEPDERAVPQEYLIRKKYENYYDINNTITTAVATNPNDPDAQVNVGGVLTNVYNQEKIYEALGRTAEFLHVVNDSPAGGPTLFVICAHQGGQHFSKERPIYPQEVKMYLNVYELRLRSTDTINYRVSEYELRRI